MDDLLQEFRGYVEKFDKLQMRNSKENERGGVESVKELYECAEKFMAHLVRDTVWDVHQKAEAVCALFEGEIWRRLRETYWDFEKKTVYLRYAAWFFMQEQDDAVEECLKKMVSFIIPDLMGYIEEEELLYLIRQKSILSCLLLEEYDLAGRMGKELPEEGTLNQKLFSYIESEKEKQKDSAIYLNDIIVDGNKIYFDYQVKGYVWRFFRADRLVLEYENAGEIKTDKSMLTAALLGSGMWLIALIFHADIYVGEIDKDFLESLEEIAEGFRKTYPELDLHCDIKYDRAVSNKAKEGTILFFSGGADSTYALSQCSGKRPVLVTLIGADMKLNACGAGVITEDTKRAAEQGGGLEYRIIKSNMRTVYNEETLSEELHKRGVPEDLWWWDGFNHGMGTISSILPLMKQLGNEIIFSSTYSERDGKVQWGGQPHLDGGMKAAGGRVQYSGFRLKRIEKIESLVQKRKEEGRVYKLRVCASETGQNCCRCENCMMAMLTLYALGEDADVWGFHNLRFFEEMLKKKERAIAVSERKKVFWEEIVEIGEKNRTLKNSRIEGNHFRW